MLRPILVKLHHYVGLALVGILSVAGLTGMVLAFEKDIDAALNPDLYVARGPSALTPLELKARVEAEPPEVRVWGLPLQFEAGRTATLLVKPRTADALDFNELFVDPASGWIVGKRLWGEASFHRKDFIPFLYRLHMDLALGDPGVWIMGIAALFWTIDCFAGAVLTFPRGRPFPAKWRPAWQVKRGASAHPLVLYLHQATVLWLWAILLVVAFSVFALSLHPVYRPMISAISPPSPKVADQVPARATALVTAKATSKPMISSADDLRRHAYGRG